jgi:hypothetical protein
MLSAVPCRNLIENIGFSGGGAHIPAGSEFELKRLRLEHPLRHPDFILPDPKFDRAYSHAFTSDSSSPLWRRLARKLKRMISTA